ncbi:sodium-dependent proline transporter-like [Ostrea edulis]|uniref:sodium-dependent proline transporter-like n=1 Tax=Ostrea edulis TaxID=37623 RepID=UPI0024AFB00A|nr:sodium-dependent proline transporter-like [Ostrea edulis]
MEMKVKSRYSSPGSSDLDSDHSENERGRWGRKLDYMLSMIGYCVGLGNIWRFPYLCMRNGGGAFLIPFVFFLMVCGLPLYFLEVSLGQFTGKGCFHVWEACPVFKGIGVGMFNGLFVIILYYNIINSWTLFYMGNSFFSPVPWTRCDEEWNTPACINDIPKTTSNSTMMNVSVSFTQLLFGSNHSNYSTAVDILNGTKDVGTTSEEQFWFNRALDLSEGLHDISSLNWRLTLCFLAAWIVVCLCLINGVKSLGKVVYVTATLPYLLLTVILIKGLTLPGSIDGILFYIRPDFNKLANVQVWLEAGLQVFYSLGPGWGPLITMASYNKFNNNCYRDSIILALISEGTSIFGGFAIFTIVGYMAHIAGKPVEDVVQAGPGLAFLVYPAALSELPFPNVWAVVFFVMLFTVGLDSQFAKMETCMTAVSDTFPRLRRHKALLSVVLCSFFFLAGLLLCTNAGLYIFQLLDWYVAAIGVPLFGVLECLIFGWIYGAENMSRDIEMMIGRSVPVYMRILWCIITPLLLMVLLIFSMYTYRPPMVGSYTYPGYARVFGWFVALLPLVPIPICAFRVIRRSNGETLYQKLCASLKPSEAWRPVSTSESEKYNVEGRFSPRDMKSTILRNILGKES